MRPELILLGEMPANCGTDGSATPWLVTWLTSSWFNLKIKSLAKGPLKPHQHTSYHYLQGKVLQYHKNKNKNKKKIAQSHQGATFIFIIQMVWLIQTL